MSEIDKRRYSGPNRTGICICGHTWQDHHLGIVLNEDYLNKVGESYLPEECEFYGFDEMGGKDADGHIHCDKYRDTGETASEKLS